MKLPFRPSPLDWTQNRSAVPPNASDAPPGPVDVIVPVYGAAAELALCLASLRRHTDLGRNRLVLVIDGPQEPAVEEAVGLARESIILRNSSRCGFVGSVNRGMAASDRDVILLNSDTEVTAGWVEKLQEAAYSHPAIATVTPFSNNATIASLPRGAAVNTLPAGWTVDGFAALVEQVTARERPRLPTGVGVCLYIKRKALDLLGPFDETHFGLGYGEESEFCFRALKAGFLNVLDDATFIWHAGQRSFGASRTPRVRAAHRAMRRLHPEYLPTIARFLRDDPLAPARERVTAELRRIEAARRPALPVHSALGPRRVVHLVHGWPPWNYAGTEVYARRLALSQAARRDVAVYARFADPERELGEALEVMDGGVRVRLMVNNFTQRNPLSRNALHDRRLAADFRRFLAETRPDLIHVHHLAGHAATLMGVAAERGVPVVYQAHDWWAPCARANLFDAERRLCSGPGPAKCAACLPLTGLPPAPVLNRLLHAVRARLTRREIRRADAFYMGSQAIRDSFLALGWLRPGDDAQVIPYGVERPAIHAAWAPRPTGVPNPPLRFGFIGSLMPHKGVHLAVAAFRGVDPARATLTVWGDPRISPAYRAELDSLASPAVRFAGRFEEELRRETFAGIDVLLVPSLGLESFGLVAREALGEGVPVLASRRGALTELFAAGPPCGALFDPEDPGELAAWIERLTAEPGIVAGWRDAQPPVKGMLEHAEEIEALYERLLVAAGRGMD
ncbi:MAG TPA: glycosyltransferase [Thermoanaerobaculia bacterium]|jgi:GT2 family glycosyltransferase|nr:glycosyltransferase [Thermoanaerobaculia bacterium]